METLNSTIDFDIITELQQFEKFKGPANNANAEVEYT